MVEQRYAPRTGDGRLEVDKLKIDPGIDGKGDDTSGGVNRLTTTPANARTPLPAPNSYPEMGRNKVPWAVKDVTPAADIYDVNKVEHDAGRAVCEQKITAAVGAALQPFNDADGNNARVPALPATSAAFVSNIQRSTQGISFPIIAGENGEPWHALVAAV